MSYSHNKKAQERLTFNLIIYIILALIAITFLLVLVSRIIGLTNSTQGSMVSFKRLTLGVDTLIANENATACHIPFFIEDNYALVGFGKQRASLTRSGLIDNDEILRPVKECHMDKSCLTLCDVGSYVNDGDCKDANLIDFKQFKDVEEFEYVYKFEDTSPLVYYGSDGGVEYLSLQKIGDPGNYKIRIYNRAEKLTADSKPCEAFMKEEDLGKIKALQKAVPEP